ncbi:uncharacterized protein LOC118438259 [Folsomia candida]|uniref:Uncharacterized protein n=1 Tax=Folsomia candida TaxID=158441 RepID=A0A226DHU1_FOLCA|nr:uncharacterized protein LOC118438259 [Folsomia candida]OXA44700.1 hypothetical protein Fcan01_20431 [Folsomia candida]
MKQLNLLTLSLVFFLQLHLLQETLAYQDYGQPCRPSNYYNFNLQPCRDWLGLTCTSGTCQCRLTNSSFDTTRHSCVASLGSECDGATECATGYCNRRRRCQCHPGQRLASDGRSCLKRFGEICSNDSNCDTISRLRCVSGVCACPNQTETYYHHDTSLCRVRIGSVCQQANDGLQCPTDANCVPIPNPELQNFSWCQCNSTYPTPSDSFFGYKSSSSRNSYPTCLRVHTHNDSCHDGLSPSRIRNVCNSTSLLTCVAGRCSCDVDRDHKWDSVNERCAVEKGRTCFMRSNNILPESININVAVPTDREVHCMAGLKCVILTNTEYLSKGICTDE